MSRVSVLPAALLLLAAAPIPAGAAPPAAPSDPYAPGRAVIAEIDHIVTPNGVQESFEAVLGGMRQMVYVRGADRANPILLFVHGGPGAVEAPISWAFQRPWEDYFTVVQWDQRGAGRSFELEDPKALAPTLSVERYRDDAIELIDLLRRRYGQRKVILMGHSWGSILGLSVAVKRPDLLWAYVGVGQVIDFRRNEAESFGWTLAQARADHNAAAVAELEGIEPYPGSGDFDLAKVGVERKWSIHYGALAAGRTDSDFYFHPARLSPEYTTADRQAWDDGSAFTMATLFPKLASVSFEGVGRIGAPVFMFLGRHDETTPSDIAARWLGRLEAPSATLVWFEYSSHLPMIEEPGRMLVELVERVRPLAGAPPARLPFSPTPP